MDKLSKFMPLVVVVVLLAIGGFVIFSGSDDGGSATVGTDEPSSVVDPADDPDEPADPAGPVASSLATIQGVGSYPSEALPDDYEVCARPVEGGGDTCTGEFEGLDFSIEVEQGRYTVYAVSASNSYVAYDNVWCAAQDRDVCETVDPRESVVFELAEGGSVSDVDPRAWYGPDDYEAFIAR